MHASVFIARSMLEAYGGQGRWSAAKAVEARLSLHGLLFRWKRRSEGSWPDLRVRAEIGHPRTRLQPFDRAGNVGVLEGHTVRIERPGGEVLESRSNAREVFPYGRRLFSWDRLDITYFVGYAEVSAIARARPAGTALRAWHDRMLAHGSPPPRHVRTLLGV